MQRQPKRLGTQSPTPAICVHPALNGPAASVGDMPTDACTVAVVDDHHVFRIGLVHALGERGIAVIAEAASGPEAVEAVLDSSPAVALMDLGLPGFDGVEATRRIIAAGSRTQILALTIHPEQRRVVAALAAGVAGYLLKDAPVDEVVDAIRATARGDAPISARAARGLVEHLQEVHRVAPAPSAPPPRLTPRELDVLALVAEGCDNVEIAERLVISPHTVKTHVSRILAKLEVSSRVQAVVRSYRQGLLLPPAGIAPD